VTLALTSHPAPLMCAPSSLRMTGIRPNLPQVTIVGAGGLEVWYTISVLEGDNPVTLGGDTVAPNATLYKGPVTVSRGAAGRPEPHLCRVNAQGHQAAAVVCFARNSVSSMPVGTLCRRSCSLPVGTLLIVLLPASRRAAGHHQGHPLDPLDRLQRGRPVHERLRGADGGGRAGDPGRADAAGCHRWPGGVPNL
jgi:hypothetical protein